MAIYFISLNLNKQTNKNPRGRNYLDFIDKEIGSKQLKYLLKFKGQANCKTKTFSWFYKIITVYLQIKRNIKCILSAMRVFHTSKVFAVRSEIFILKNLNKKIE